MSGDVGRGAAKDASLADPYVYVWDVEVQRAAGDPWVVTCHGLRLEETALKHKAHTTGAHAVRVVPRVTKSTPEVDHLARLLTANWSKIRGAVKSGSPLLLAAVLDAAEITCTLPTTDTHAAAGSQP